MDFHRLSSALPFEAAPFPEEENRLRCGEGHALPGANCRYWKDQNQQSLCFCHYQAACSQASSPYAQCPIYAGNLLHLLSGGRSGRLHAQLVCITQNVLLLLSYIVEKLSSCAVLHD